MKRILFLIFLILCAILVVCRANRVDNKNPLVSVVMPVYNREDLASRAIESILNQTYPHFEFIIVDDGSTDKTAEILRQYAQKDSRIRIVTNAKNCGISCARNRGMDAAVGKYIVIMDSDDVSLPIRLEKSVTAMEENQDITVLSGWAEDIKKPRDDKWLENPKSYHIGVTPETIQIEMMFYNQLFNIASIIRRDFLVQNNIRYNEEYKSAEDYDFWKQILLKGGQIGRFDEVVCLVRFHSSNELDYYKQMGTRSFAIKKEFFDRFFENDLKDIKFEYNESEKCHMLNKIEQANQHKKVMKPEIIRNVAQNLCPPLGTDWVYIEHPHWKGFVVFQKEGRLYRHPSKIAGTYTQKEGVLKVEWEGWDPEEFRRQKDGRYKFFDPNIRQIEVEHPHWSDTLIFQKEGVCRQNSKDCAKVLEETPNKIRIKWDNWGEETFKKAPKTHTFYYVKGA